MTVQTRGSAVGYLRICLDEAGDLEVGKMQLIPSENWRFDVVRIESSAGEFPLFFHYQGEGESSLLAFQLKPVRI